MNSQICPGIRKYFEAFKQIIYSILNDTQKHKFEENWELDFSFGIKGVARFRANVFMQRGAVAGAFRRIPYEIWGFEKLGLPKLNPTPLPSLTEAINWSVPGIFVMVGGLMAATYGFRKRAEKKEVKGEE